LSLEPSNFVRKIVRIFKEKKKKWAMRKSFVYSLIQIGFTLGTNALEPCPMGSNVNHP
jgi:hypothetical protein